MTILSLELPLRACIKPLLLPIRVFGFGPQKGTKSCRTQGESVIRLYIPLPRGLSQPQGGLNLPLGGLSQTLGGLNQLLGGPSQAQEGLNQPMGGLSQALGGLG